MILVSVTSLGANDDILSDWVVIPSGDLILQNNVSHPLELQYSVPSAQGLKNGILRIEPKKTESIGLSAYQVFRSELQITWHNVSVLHSARKYLGEMLTKKYGVPFKCDPACCRVSCQSENLIRGFMMAGKRFTSELEEYKKTLRGTKVKLEFSHDSNGFKVTTTIGGFTESIRF